MGTVPGSHLGYSLGLKPVGTPALIQQIEQGLSFRALDRLANTSGIPLLELGQLIGLSERTFARRKGDGQLNKAESESLLRAAFLFEKAVELFEGDAASAASWLRKPQRVLSGHTPLERARTDVGTREVERFIGQLEHGIFP